MISWNLDCQKPTIWIHVSIDNAIFTFSKLFILINSEILLDFFKWFHQIFFQQDFEMSIRLDKIAEITTPSMKWIFDIFHKNLMNFNFVCLCQSMRYFQRRKQLIQSHAFKKKKKLLLCVHVRRPQYSKSKIVSNFVDHSWDQCHSNLFDSVIEYWEGFENPRSLFEVRIFFEFTR